MLLRRFKPTPDSGAVATLSSPAALLTMLAGVIRRQLLLIILITLSVFGLGLAYVITAPSQFTATALLLLDSRRIIIKAEQSPAAEAGYDPARVESQVQLLQTDTIALSVIKKLDLTKDPEFACRSSTPTAPLLHLFAAEKPCSEFERRRTAASAFANRLTVRRKGFSYLLEISFTSGDPERAAQIANEVAEAHIVDQMDARYQVIKRSSAWLQERLRELADQSSAAQRTVNEFKVKHDIIDPGGRLSNDQQLAEHNSQLVAARAQVSETKARLDRIEVLLHSESPDETVDATVTDTLRSDIINRLRIQYLDTQRRVNDWSVRYGEDHLAVIQARTQMREIRASIHDELKRIAETYKSDYDIAKRKLDGTQAELARAIAESQLANKAQVELRELESNAQTSRALYDNFLQRYMDAAQQQSFPITEARIVAPASPPLRKSRPRAFLVLVLSLGGGLIAAVGIGLLRDSWYPVFRSSTDVEDTLQARCLAVLPLLGKEPRWSTAKRAPRLLSAAATSGVNAQDASHLETPRPDSFDAPTVEAPQRVIKVADGPLWRVVKSPLSAFTESIRSIKLAVDLDRSGSRSKVIGITSALPYEGKSTISGALALLMAQTGARTVLVDGDLRNPVLTRTLAPDAQLGFLDIISEKAKIGDVIWTNETGTLTFLPGVINQRLAHTTEILASPRATALMEMLREQYDNVVVDLSPLTPVVDVRATAQLIDAYVLVVEWGRTRGDLVEHVLRDAQGLCDSLLGVVLNKAPPDGALFGYRDRSSGYYYSGFDKRD
jgi:succinoglycan biosynthesis transport protein ExoP